MQGLSHFLEHVLFQGSLRFPYENEIFQFLNRNCGFVNGVTKCENTVYHLGVLEHGLEGAVNRIAQMILNPSMSEKLVKREKHIINLEYRGKMNNNSLKREHILASMTAKGHPGAKFCCGSLKSLRKLTSREFHKRLKAFKEQHYLSNRMSICMYSSLSLDALQASIVSV